MTYKSRLRRTFTLFGLLAVVASACSSSAQTNPTTRPADTLIPQPVNTAIPQPSPTPAPLCSGDASRPQPHGTLTLPGASAELVWQSEFVPWWVRTSPDGRVLAATDGGDSIYELKPDGALAIAFRCPGVQIETFAAASDGALWFATRDGGRLYRVAPDGTVKILAQNGNRNLEPGPDGSVYALENGLTRIDQDGAPKLITKEVSGRKFAIGPNGEIVVLSGGKILRVSEAGELTEIAAGYGPEEWLTFGPDGLLYVTHWTGVDTIDLNSGAVNSIPWLEASNISESSDFAPDGRLLLYHPNTDVYAVDLAAQTVEVFHQVTSNSWAMGVNPGDAVYVAYGSNLPNGQTTIYRIVDQQTLEPIGSVPYGIERSMSFDTNGVGYLAVGDRANGGAIFRFDPKTGAAEPYQRPQCFPDSLTIDPRNNQLWWYNCDHFESLDQNNNLVKINGVPRADRGFLAITPAGEFYAVAFFPRQNPNIPYERRLYRWDEAASTWKEVADMTQSDPGITLALPVACPDGRIYTVEGLDGSHLPHGSPSWNALRRLEPDGALTVLGYDFSYDGLAAACDPSNGRIIFTSGAGIFAVTSP